MITTMSTPVARSFGDVAARAPSSTSSDIASGRRSYTLRRNPAPARRIAIFEPIFPSPTNPTRFFVMRITSRVQCRYKIVDCLATRYPGP